MYNKMDNSVFEEYVKWSRTKDLTSFAQVFKAGWEASEASRSVDQSLVLVDLQDFIEVAQKYPNVIGRPVYYAQWPSSPRQK
jgi:hypothetical protein